MLAAPLLWFPSRTRSLALLLIPSVWIVAWIARGKPLPITPLNGTLLLFSLMVLVSLYATYDIMASLPRLSGIVLSIGAFFAVAREGQRARGWWWGFLVFLTTSLGMAGLGLLGTRWLAKFGFLAPITSRLAPHLASLSGTGRGFHPNQIAGTLLWVVPVLHALSILLLARGRDLRAVFGRGRIVIITSVLIVVTMFLTSVFVLTQSRSGYIGFALVALLSIMIALPSRRRWLFLGSLVIVAIVIWIIVWRYGADAVLEKLLGKELADDPAFSLATMPGRLELWSRAIYAIQDFPFTGMGMNVFRYVVHTLYPLFLVSPDVDVGHAHNAYLQAALDLGIPGLIAFLALHIEAFWMLFETWRTIQSPGLSVDSQGPQAPLLDCRPVAKAMVLGLGGGLLAHMLYGLTDAVMLGSRQGVLFWMMLGLICGLFSQVRSGMLVEWATGPSALAWHRRSARKESELRD